MKKIILCCAVFCLFAFTPKGIRATTDFSPLPPFKDLLDKNLELSVNAQTQHINYLSSQSGSIPLTKKLTSGTTVANQFLKEYSNYFGLTDVKNAKKITSIKDRLGLTHIHYQQVYNNVPVFGAELLLHLGKKLNVQSANGKLWPVSGINTKPQLKEKQVKDLSKKYWKETVGVNASKKIKLDTKLFIFNEKIFNARGEDKNALVWRVTAFDPNTLQKEFFFIDAQTGKLTHRITGNKTIERYVRNCNNGNTDCMLGDANTAAKKGRSEGDPSVTDNQINNVYDFLYSTYRYFEAKFHLDGANNHGGTGDGSATYPRDAIVAYMRYKPDAAEKWTCPNAMWNGSSFMLCSNMDYLKVIAHEYMHAVSDFNAANGPLIYEGESGSISEALSDIFAAAVDRRVNDSTDWIINAGAITYRDIPNPSNTHNPNTTYSADFACRAPCDGTNDHCDVHGNSTVVSHSAYLMSEGGQQSNCQISGIGHNKVEEIFYRALTNYLTTSASFHDLYNAIRSSCADLYGGASSDCRQVTKAMQAVELDQDGACSATPQEVPLCGPPFIKAVTSLTPNGTYKTGDSIHILVFFSKPVNADLVAVTLDTERNDTCQNSGTDCDVSCSFAVNSLAFGSCTYTVRDGDTSSDLNVLHIGSLGGIKDLDNRALTNYTPRENLAENKDIVLDAKLPELQTPLETDLFDLAPNLPKPSDNTPIPDATIDIPEIPAIENPLPTATQNPTATDKQPTPKQTPPPRTPKPVDTPPDISVSASANGTVLTVEGVIHSYGTTEKCLGPRYFDPAVINWGRSLSTPQVKDKHFSASYDYKEAKNRSYTATILVTNSCYDVGTKRYKVDVGTGGLTVTPIK